MGDINTPAYHNKYKNIKKNILSRINNQVTQCWWPAALNFLNSGELCHFSMYKTINLLDGFVWSQPQLVTCNKCSAIDWNKSLSAVAQDLIDPKRNRKKTRKARDVDDLKKCRNSRLNDGILMNAMTSDAYSSLIANRESCERHLKTTLRERKDVRIELWGQVHSTFIQVILLRDDIITKFEEFFYCGSFCCNIISYILVWSSLVKF